MAYGVEAFGNLRTIDDYKRAKEQFEMDKMLKQAQIQKVQAAAQSPGGGSLPAALQLTNEYEKAIKGGDTERAARIEQFAKTVDKGVYRTPQGAYEQLPGYGQAMGEIGAQKSGMQEQAKQEQRTAYEPQRASMVEEQKLQQQLQYRPQIKEAEKVADVTAQKRTELGERQASMPQLEQLVGDLSELGKKATYTYAGQAGDFITRQTGGEVDEGAIARKEYISKVDNEVLPLLRQTFGAQFTEKEGESLKATLGDPNASPEEKDAVLRSFIETKKRTINSIKRELGLPITDRDNNTGVNSKTTTQNIKRSDIPMGAIRDLKNNPNLAAQFEEVFGKGSSNWVLGK